jgi:AraC-like DNA-binding protein
MRHPDWSAHALPLNDHLFQEPLYVTHAGWEKVVPHQSYPRPGHPSYYGFTWEEGRVLGEFCLSLLTQGRGEVQTKKGRQLIRAGQAFLYEPGEWHRHRPTPSIGWSIVWLNFNGGLAHRWLQESAFLLNKNLIKVSSLRLFRAQFQHLVDSIESLGTRNSLLFSWQAIGLISQFLSDCSSANQTKTTGSGDALVDSAMDYIWSQSHNRIGAADVAIQTGVNRRTLERRFKAVTASTLLNELQRCRISRAALLLRETSVPIKYIIGRAGFANYQRLREAFHKHFGQSPENYRRNPANRTV